MASTTSNNIPQKCYTALVTHADGSVSKYVIPIESINENQLAQLRRESRTGEIVSWVIRTQKSDKPWDADRYPGWEGDDTFVDIFPYYVGTSGGLRKIDYEPYIDVETFAFVGFC